MKPTNNYGLSDSLIDAVRKVVEEAKLHPNQQKLDVHEPEKDELTSQDFKKLRSGKKVEDGIDTNPKLKEESKVYDPITKKIVAIKPIKVQAGGGATRNGVPFEPGPSKFKNKLPISKEVKEEQMDEAHRRGGNRFLNTREKDAIQKKMKPLDPNAPVEYKDKHSITRGLPHEEQLIRHIHAATGHHVYISPFTHDMHPHDSKEVITKEVYNTGGKGTYGGPGGTKHTANSLVNAVKKFHNKKLRAEEYEQMDEARSEPVDIAFETRRGKTENQQEVEHAARYEKSHGVKSKFADGPNGRTVVYSHSDPKKVKGALIKHHGGEDVSHIKIKEAYEQIDELSVNKMLKYTDAANKNREVLNTKWDKGTATEREKNKVLSHERGVDSAAARIKAKTGKNPNEIGKLSRMKYAVTKEEEQMDEAPLRAVSALVGYPKLDRKIATKGTPGSEDERNKAAAGLRKDRSGLGRRAYTGDQHYDVRREEVDQIDEVKLADLPRRKVVGKSYGADYVDPEGADETAADMKKPEPKRKSGPQGTMKRRFIKDKSKLRMQYK